MNAALVVIDMQNGFLHPGGENYFPHPGELVDNCLQLIEHADTTGALIVHVADRHRPGFGDFEWRRLPEHCIGGGSNAAYFDGFGPKSRNREIEIIKRRFSAFFATDLALFLQEQSIEKVIICGVKTNVCIRATAQDAFATGFDVIVVEDATSSNRGHLAAASLEDIERYMGQVVDTCRAKEMLG